MIKVQLTSSAEHHPHSGSARHSGCVRCLGQAVSGSLLVIPACQLGTTYARRSPKRSKQNNKYQFSYSKMVFIINACQLPVLNMPNRFIYDHEFIKL